MQNSSTASLGRRAMLGTLQFVVFLAAMIFLAAGTLSYWQGWLLWINFSAWCIALTLYFVINDPDLVERRLRAGPSAEREPAQKRIQAFASIAVIANFVLPALDYRFDWSDVPPPVVTVGNALVAIGFVATFFVFRENSFAAATIQIARDQRVISSGPYALLRHPMYAAALVMLTGVPLALGSWWGLLTIPPLVAVLVWRLQDEENYLIRNLAGYEDYRRRVRYRLVPGVW